MRLPLRTLFPILVVATLTILDASAGPDPPASAKRIQCVGTAVRQVCVGDTASHMYDVLGTITEVEAWYADDEAPDHSDIIRVFELNRGRAGCWITLTQNPKDPYADRITHIRCVGL